MEVRCDANTATARDVTFDFLALTSMSSVSRSLLSAASFQDYNHSASALSLLMQKSSLRSSGELGQQHGVQCGYDCEHQLRAIFDRLSETVFHQALRVYAGLHSQALSR